jgi:hypothetical protein
MTRTLLVAGTASHVGKSTVAAGLCRLLARRGVSVAPFKAQNMSNNARAVVNPDGGWGEIGVSQCVQAKAAGVAPTTDHNPVFLKPRGEGEVGGEMDDLSAFARPGFDPEAVAPAVRDFYERTADHELAYEVGWHRPFRSGAALAARLTSRLEQLNLPGPGESGVERLESRFEPVAADADPRADARAWVRTREEGTAVFVAIYAHHDREEIRYVNIAVPLPRGNLSTVLRPENLADGGLELTTLDGEAEGDEGLYLATPVGSVALPLDQRFRVWPADSSDPSAPTDLSRGRATVVATHEMWLFGRQFLMIRYAGWPRR